VPNGHDKARRSVLRIHLGVVIAFFFAVAVRFIPAERIVNPLARLCSTPPRRLLRSRLHPHRHGRVARLRGESPRQVLLWACAGALAFDGLALGFRPALYAQEGLALTGVATPSLCAFARIVAAALLFASGDGAKS
jgi:hypothetical protein